MNIRSVRVGTRVLVLLTLLLLGGIILGASLLNNFTVGIIQNNNRASLRGEAETIQQALDYTFTKNDFETAQQMVSRMSLDGHIRTIRILNRDGKIILSSIPSEVGIRLDVQSPSCSPCHADKTNLSRSIEQVEIMKNNEAVMVTANPLVNQIGCQNCHALDGANLGIILTEHDAEPANAQLANIRLSIFAGTGILFIFLTGVGWFTFRQTVTKPLNDLVSQKNLTNQVNRQDEFGQLARKLIDIEALIEEKDDQLNLQKRNFRAFQVLTESIDVTLSPEKILQFSINKIQDITGFNTVAMRLFETDSQSFRLVAQTGMSPQMVDDLRNVPAPIGFTGDVYKTHRAAYTTNLSEDPRLESLSPVVSGFKSLISVPFLSGDRLMGSMELASKNTHVWLEDEIAWLELIGRSIGNVLHHIETSNQLQGLAVIQERSLIAQEIHDGLVQLIGTLRLWAEDAQIALQENKLQVVQDDLQKIEDNAKDAYASLREEILGLRETLKPGKSILPVIHEFLARFQRQWGIETRLIVSPETTDDKLPFILPVAEIQLLRIIQESMVNIRRHANAKLAVVSFKAVDGHLRVEIRDNGNGFDPQNIPEEKLGLRIIRERATSIGARVSVNSIRGEGSCITVELPTQIPFILFNHPSDGTEQGS